jgi:phage baseplate assembly protein W
MATTYKGFSTIGQTRKFRLTDFELVQRDIINNFNIRKGEKLMNPSFGTIIYNVIHEPFTEDLKSIITNDIKAIAKYDPRVSFDNIVVTEYDQGLQILLQLRYLPTDQTSMLNMQFDSQTNRMTLAPAVK